jgi:hypothetical protein
VEDIKAAAVTYSATVRNRFNQGAKGVLSQQRENASVRMKLAAVSHACSTREGEGRRVHRTELDGVVYSLVLSFDCLFV